MNCPNCGSNLVSKGKFCPFCGSSIPEDILIRMESKSEILDHGRIADANKEIRQAEEKTNRGKIAVKIVLILVIGFIVLCVIALVSGNRQNQLYEDTSSKTAAYEVVENTRLQKIENEILEDIRKGNYEQALIKTELLRYSSEGSYSTKHSWDEKRNGLVEKLQGLINQSK